MKTKILTYCCLSLVILPQKLVAEVRDEMKRFQKCYAIMVGERVPSNDALWLSVKNAKISGSDACMQIFDLAKLDNNGEVKKISGVHSIIGAKVLHNFMKFHKSQLQAPDYGSAIGTGSDRFTRDVIDTNEAVYHFLYSAFGTNQKYSDIITRDFSLKAIRKSSFPNRVRSILNVNLPKFEQGRYITVMDENGVNQVVPDANGVLAFTPELVETGTLVGVTKETRNNPITHLTGLVGFNFTSYNVNQHLGAGAIGTQAYLLANLGKDANNNGGTGLYRRWGKHVMEDFLCRYQPSVRNEDTIDDVDVNSKISFRTGPTCMACHSTMDPITGVIRNARTAWSNNTTQVSTRVKFVGHRVPNGVSAEFPKMQNDTAFYLKNPDGRLFYRSYDGTLVKEEVTGLDELGEAIKKTNDLYVCAAKRYYQFFTGIDVSLLDIGAISTPEYTRGEMKQRQRVINMGLELKKHESVRTLIKSIIEADAFIYPDKGV